MGDESGVVGITQRELLMEMRDDIHGLRSVVESVARETGSRRAAAPTLGISPETVRRHPARRVDEAPSNQGQSGGRSWRTEIRSAGSAPFAKLLVIS